MPLSFMDSLIVLQDSQTRVSVKVSDSLNALIDPHRLILTVTNISGQIVFNDIWPSPSNRIVRAALGQFYVDFGTPIEAEHGTQRGEAHVAVVVGDRPHRLEADRLYPL
jgi:hypothetical protein